MATLTSGSFPGPAGAIEYLLNLPEGDGAAATRAAVVCHPHPLGGGTMHTRLVFHAAAALRGMGMPVLRFQFRGVGRSAGEHDAGRGEQDDFLAALAFLRSQFPLPIVAAGFSFGAWVLTRTLARLELPEIERVVLLGLPADRVRIPNEWRWHGPKLLISGARDQFASPEALTAYAASLAPPKQLFLVPEADHFLAGHEAEFTELLTHSLDFA